MDRIRKTTPLLLVLAAGLILASRSYLLENLITPLAFLFWGAWRLVASVDQEIYWAGLVLLCGGWTAWLLIPRKAPMPNRAYQDSYRPPDRFEHWREMLAESRGGAHKAGYLRKTLAELAMSAFAQEGNGVPADIETRTAEKAVSLSPAARQYLFGSGEKLEFLEALRSRFGERDSGEGRTQKSSFWGGRLRVGRGAALEQQATLEEILRWMEIELGMRDEAQ